MPSLHENIYAQFIILFVRWIVKANTGRAKKKSAPAD